MDGAATVLPGAAWSTATALPGAAWSTATFFLGRLLVSFVAAPRGRGLPSPKSIWLRIFGFPFSFIQFKFLGCRIGVSPRLLLLLLDAPWFSFCGGGRGLRIAPDHGAGSRFSCCRLLASSGRSPSLLFRGIASFLSGDTCRCWRFDILRLSDSLGFFVAFYIRRWVFYPLHRARLQVLHVYTVARAVAGLY